MHLCMHTLIHHLYVTGVITYTFIYLFIFVVFVCGNYYWTARKLLQWHCSYDRSATALILSGCDLF